MIRPLLLLPLLWPLSAPPPASALTLWQIGTGIQGGYNSKLIQPVVDTRFTTNVQPVGDAVTLVLTPFFLLQTVSGRITESFELRGVLDGFIPIDRYRGDSCPQCPVVSYQVHVASQTRVDITARLAWTFGVIGTGGEINTYNLALGSTQTPSADTSTVSNSSQQPPPSGPMPNTQPQTQLLPATVATQFMSVNLTSNLRWEPTARLRLSQPIAFRSFIPFNTINTRTPFMTESTPVTQSFQSYSVDGGLGLDYLLARVSLGAELRVGWFLPQQGAAASVAPSSGDNSIVTGQLLGRTAAELSPRWIFDAHVGVFVATRAGNFFGPNFLYVTCPGGPTTYRACLDGNTYTSRREADSTLIAPLGGAQLRYLFPQVGADLGLAYQHGAGGDVFAGRITLTDAVTLRMSLPLPKNVGLAASGGYRYSQLTGTDSISPINEPSYHIFQADASIFWKLRDGVSLFLRYQYLRQIVITPDPTADPTGLMVPYILPPDYDRHVALAGIALIYPPR